MKQFVVPQFIDIEPKILGPLNVRQFIILMICALLIVAEWKTSSFFTFIVEAVFTVFIAGIFGFYKINGQPFHYFLLNFIQSMKKPKLRVWKKVPILIKNAKKVKGEEEEKTPPTPVKKLPLKKLSELSLVIDTGGAYREEE